MNGVQGLLEICFLAITLQVIKSSAFSLTSHHSRLHHVSTRSVSEFCSGVVCRPLPRGAQCTEVDKGDTSVPRPKGKQSDCCPFFKCKDPDGSKTFVFHGYFGRGPSIKASKDEVVRSPNNTNSTKGPCGTVSCKPPPTDSNCSSVLGDDTSLKRPKGAKADCCPLLKCYEKDGSFFPFHGYFGRGPSQKAPSNIVPKNPGVPTEDKEKAACSGFSCKPIPTNATCDEVSPSDASVKRPKGGKASCCPLYKCQNGDGSHFPFHGAFGKGPVVYPPKEKVAELSPPSSVDSNSNDTKVPISSSSSQTVCAGVSCKQPPEDGSCTLVNQSDPSMPPPKGVKSGCCSLHKCIARDGLTFPFHGFYGKGPAMPAPTKPSVCSTTICKMPPTTSTCSVVNGSDPTMQGPKGRLSQCCSMYRCEDSDGTYFPFHGAYGAGPKKVVKPTMTIPKTPPPEAKKPPVVSTTTSAPVTQPQKVVMSTTPVPLVTVNVSRIGTEKVITTTVSTRNSFLTTQTPTKAPITNDRITTVPSIGKSDTSGTTAKPMTSQPMIITTFKPQVTTADYLDKFMQMPSMTFGNGAGKIMNIPSNDSSHIPSATIDGNTFTPGDNETSGTTPSSYVKEFKFFDPNGGEIEVDKIAKGKANATASVFVGDPDAPPVDPAEQQKEFDNMEAEMNEMMKSSFGSGLLM